MMAATHVLAGVAAWSGGCMLAGMPAEPAALTAAGLGALLPDIDQPQSWFGRRVRVVSVPVAMIFGHRGITHSLLALFVCLAGLVLLGRDAVAAPVILGYLSHLLCDSITVGGVPLLWPWRRPFGLRLVRTGSPLELAFAAGLLALVGQPWLPQIAAALR
jgi:inner membrane protein